MAKRKLNPMERALAQADNIIAANQELERVSAQFHDRRSERSEHIAKRKAQGGSPNSVYGSGPLKS